MGAALNDCLKAAALADAKVLCAYGEASIDAVSFTAVELSTHVNEPLAVLVPPGFLLSHFAIALGNVAGGPTFVTARASWDAAKDYLMSNEMTQQLYLGDTAGRASLTLDFAAPGAPLKRPTGIGVYGKMWLHLLLDAGTADAQVWAYFRPLAS